MFGAGFNLSERRIDFHKPSLESADSFHVRTEILAKPMKLLFRYGEFAGEFNLLGAGYLFGLACFSEFGAELFLRSDMLIKFILQFADGTLQVFDLGLLGYIALFGLLLLAQLEFQTPDLIAVLHTVARILLTLRLAFGFLAVQFGG